MSEIADFDKPFSVDEKAPCVCGHGRVFHEKHCCGMAACNKCKGFAPRPPEPVATVALPDWLNYPWIPMLGARQIMWHGTQAMQSMPDGVWMAVNLPAKRRRT